MFTELRGYLPLPYDEPNGPQQWAVAESLLLHILVLADFLVSQRQSPGALTLDSTLPGFATRHAGTLQQLREVWGSRQDIGAPCQALNNMLTHLTPERAGGYDYTVVADSVLPLMTPLVSALRAELETGAKD